MPFTPPIFQSFNELAHSNEFAPAPQEYLIAICDISGSAEALERGQFKEVNLCSAAAIMAVLNEINHSPIPYTFGGDGATFLFPPEQRLAIERALQATRKMAREQFGITMRVGVVPIADLTRAGAEVKVALLKISKHLTQYHFAGSGITTAEKWIKEKRTYQMEESTVTANFSGLECRWDPIVSQQGEILTLIVQSQNGDLQYQQILNAIDRLYGHSYTPALLNQMKLSWNPSHYWTELKITLSSKRSLKRIWSFALNLLVTQLLGLLNTLRLTSAVRYLREVVANSDYRKFDGMLRMVLDGRPETHNALEAILQDKASNGLVEYGSHRSTSALMTCLIFNRKKGKHLHLIDGNGGGYSSAALDLKRKLHARFEHPSKLSNRRTA